MSKKIIKISHEAAKEKIVTQHDLGIDLVKSGAELIKKSRNISWSEVDSFKLKYDHWHDITSETLNEIFHSSNYSYKFRHHRSSKVEYVNSSWQPDIKYYITKEIRPKIEFLKNLADNIQDFDETTADDVKNEENILMSLDLENLSVSELLKVLKPGQLKGVISITIAVIIGAFYFGYVVHSWKIDNDKFNLANEIKLIKEENIELKKELTTLNNDEEADNKKKSKK